MDWHHELQKQIFQHSKVNIDKKQAQYKRSYDARLKSGPILVAFKPGDLVQYVNYTKRDCKGLKFQPNFLPENNVCVVLKVINNCRLLLCERGSGEVKTLPWAHCVKRGEAPKVSKRVFDNAKSE